MAVFMETEIKILASSSYGIEVPVTFLSAQGVRLHIGVAGVTVREQVSVIVRGPEGTLLRCVPDTDKMLLNQTAAFSETPDTFYS